MSLWIQETLRSAPGHLPDIRRSADRLSLVVASTSGQGLNDIWSSWTSSVSPTYYAFELEQAATSMDSSETAFSESPTPRDFVSVKLSLALRSQLLEHIAKKYLKASTTPSADQNLDNVLVLPDLEQVSPTSFVTHRSYSLSLVGFP